MEQTGLSYIFLFKAICLVQPIEREWIRNEWGSNCGSISWMGCRRV